MTISTQVKTAQITCVKKRDRFNPHERITHVGGPAGSGWCIPQEDAIHLIETDQWRFWVSGLGGNIVWVVVAVSRLGNKYLKTIADGEDPNNLLSLPECP